MKITITEALSEVNLIKKKLDASRSIILNNLARAKHLKDPFEGEGGSFKKNERVLQSIYDLQNRLEKIRGRISAANLEHSITIGESTKTIFDWLTWKREIAGDHQKFVSQVYASSKNTFDDASRNPKVWQDEQDKKHLLEIILNIDLAYWLKKQETLTEILEKLDGQLSLKNATITVDI